MRLAGEAGNLAGGAENPAPLVVHLIHRLAVGGLENGIVNLVNHMPANRFRHAIVCLTDYTDFRQRIRREDVPVIGLHKRAGKDWAAYRQLWSILRRMRPQILHTRTMAALDAQVYGMLAGVPARIHGEHGQASSYVNESGVKHRVLRHAFRPIVDHYTVVSKDLASYLAARVGIPGKNITQIYNGVDTGRFHPRRGVRQPLGPPGFIKEDSIVIGTVGRAQPIKDQSSLVRAFLHLQKTSPALGEKLRLVLLGDGPLLEELRGLVMEAGAGHRAWLPGERADVAEVLRAMDIFVLPSLGEGTCNTILEAMATGLPVIATCVGGNPELVIEGSTGRLVPAGDPLALSESIRRYLDNPDERVAHGTEGRRRAEERFSVPAMVEGYMSVYEAVLNRKRTGRAHAA